MNATIFPLLPDYTYLIEAIPLRRPDIKLVSVVIPRAYSKVCSVREDIKVYYDFDPATRDVDVAIFLPFDNNKKLLYNTILSAIKSNIDIICCAVFPKNQTQILLEEAKKHGVKFSFYDDSAILKSLNERGDPFVKYESVIVAVGPLTKGINTSQYVFNLYQELKKRQYRVSVISSEPEFYALGFEKLPIDAMVESDLDRTILSINRFFNLFQVRNRPAVTLLQLPSEGMHRLSEKYSTCFGAKTYLISQAVDIDYFALLTPIVGMDISVYEMMSEISEYRYGFSFNSIACIPKEIDMVTSTNRSNVYYYGVTDQDTRKSINDLKSNEKSEILVIDNPAKWAGLVADDIVAKLS